MIHSSQHLSFTPFITCFLYPWKVTQCLYLLMNLSRISHLWRERVGKDCGWWMIDELDQFILWYIHVPLNKRRCNSKWEFCIFYCVFTVFEPLHLKVVELYKKVQSMKIHCSWNQMKSDHTIKCRSIIPPKIHHFSSYSSSILMHLPHLGPSLKILSRWK